MLAPRCSHAYVPARERHVDPMAAPGRTDPSHWEFAIIARLISFDELPWLIRRCFITLSMIFNRSGGVLIQIATNSRLLAKAHASRFLNSYWQGRSPILRGALLSFQAKSPAVAEAFARQALT